IRLFPDGVRKQIGGEVAGPECLLQYPVSAGRGVDAVRDEVYHRALDNARLRLRSVERVAEDERLRVDLLKIPLQALPRVPTSHLFVEVRRVPPRFIEAPGQVQELGRRVLTL